MKEKLFATVEAGFRTTGKARVSNLGEPFLSLACRGKMGGVVMEPQESGCVERSFLAPVTLRREE